MEFLIGFESSVSNFGNYVQIYIYMLITFPKQRWQQCLIPQITVEIFVNYFIQKFVICEYKLLEFPN